MPESEQTSTVAAAGTERVPAGTVVDKATGQVIGQVWLPKENPGKDDKGRAARLAKAAAVGRVKQRWNKSDFRAFQRGLSQARRDKDAAALQKGFAAAADIPIFKEALDWAQQHGIDFFVDRTCTKHVGAYYTGGIGAIGVNRRVLQNPQLMAIYLTHEIRHAFQDVHGLLGHSMKPDFAAEAIRTALVEADAMAFETLAAHQAARATLKKRQASSGLPPDLALRLKRFDKYCADEKGDLWRGFRNWFEGGRPYFYGDAVAKREAAMLGIKGVTPPDFKYEFKAYAVPPAAPKVIDIADDAQFQKLGATFSGGNYLNEQKRREFVLRTVNNPSLARTFWRTNAKTPQLMNQLRKKELQMKQDRPKLSITAFGQAADVKALAGLLATRLLGMKGVENLEIGTRHSDILELQLTFKRGVDPVTAFRTAAARIDGQWAHVAPSVLELYIDGASAVVKGAHGRLGRSAYRPPQRIPAAR